MILSRAYWFNNLPCLAASWSLKMNQVQGTQYVLNSLAGTASNSFFSFSVINPEFKINTWKMQILKIVMLAKSFWYFYLPPLHDPKLEIFALLQMILISAPRSAQGSSISAVNVSTFWILHQSPECREQLCGNFCQATEWRGTVATIWKPRKRHRSREQMKEESCSRIHQNILQHFQTTWNIKWMFYSPFCVVLIGVRKSLGKVKVWG